MNVSTFGNALHSVGTVRWRELNARMQSALDEPHLDGTLPDRRELNEVRKTPPGVDGSRRKANILYARKDEYDPQNQVTTAALRTYERLLPRSRLIPGASANCHDDTQKQNSEKESEGRRRQRPSIVHVIPRSLEFTSPRPRPSCALTLITLHTQ